MSMRSERALTRITVVALIAVTVLGIVLTWLVVSILRDAAPGIENAVEDCETEAFPLVAGDEGDSLELRVGGERVNAARAAEQYEVLGCVLDQLDAPDSLRSKIDATTALQGRQEDSWDDFEASWTYHPDNGLDLIIEEH